VKRLSTPSARLRGAHLVALFAFGIAQPMFSLLTKQPFHLAIEGFRGVDVVVYSVALLFVVPAILLAIESLAGLVHPGAMGFLHRLFVGFLGYLVLFRALQSLPGGYWPVVALFGTLMFVRLYGTLEPIRSFMTICSVAAVFFLAVFLIRAPLVRLSTTDVHAATVQKIAARTPVVLVIFDEFDESSIMTDRGTIDSVRYPNFGALSRSSTWYRNATTVHDYTFWAVPAILTGIRPRNKQLPVLADHPRNLFTLLGNSYRINAFESVTRLCPAALCPNEQQAFGSRMRRLGRYFEKFVKRGDFLTAKFTEVLPDWDNPPAQILRFLASIHPNASRDLYVLHVLLPHHPWHYLPSGGSYSARGSLDGFAKGKWVGGTRLVNRAFDRHLLQVGYVDLVLGRIMRRLHRTGLWNRSLFIVTADHGISFRSGEQARTVDPTNIGDIAPVPLFLKRPGQRLGAVDDRSARTIDIVPTIANVLRIHIPWSVDGRSLLSRDRPFPSEIVVASIAGHPVSASWRAVNAGRARTIARKTQLFGSGNVPLLVMGGMTGIAKNSAPAH
jgi:hypothetical protein